MRGARRYRDGVAGTSHAQAEFADALRDFCGGPDGTGTDEESMTIGTPSYFEDSVAQTVA